MSETTAVSFVGVDSVVTLASATTGATVVVSSTCGHSLSGNTRVPCDPSVGHVQKAQSGSTCTLVDETAIVVGAAEVVVTLEPNPLLDEDDASVDVSDDEFVLNRVESLVAAGVSAATDAKSALRRKATAEPKRSAYRYIE